MVVDSNGEIHQYTDINGILRPIVSIPPFPTEHIVDNLCLRAKKFTE